MAERIVILAGGVGGAKLVQGISEERPVGREGRSGWSPYH